MADENSQPLPPQSSDSPNSSAPEGERPRRKILIGSQKDPDAYRPRPQRDWEPVQPPAPPPAAEVQKTPQVAPRWAAEAQNTFEPAPPPVAEPQRTPEPAPPPAPEAQRTPEPSPVTPVAPVIATASTAPSTPIPELPPAPVIVVQTPTGASAFVETSPLPAARAPEPPPESPRFPPEEETARRPMAPSAEPPAPAATPGEAREGGRGGRPGRRGEGGDRPRGRRERRPQVEKPRDLDSYPKAVHTTPLPGRTSPDLDEEIDAALADSSLEDLIAGGEAVSKTPTVELESRQMGKIVAIRRDDVFIELGGREQGVVSVRLMPRPPEVGMQLEVVVQRFNPEEGLYELNIPGNAFAVSDWADLAEGMVVEARVTGHNSGGLECEVNHIRGFIPVSQVALYRVEHLEDFVGQKFPCVVAEANPDRRNLVLSRRAFLEREREQAREQLLATLEPGQIREGVVRRLMDFGAFVDLGGVDGLVHIRELSWARVGHPKEVLQEGQTIKVRINRIDPETGKISLGYREMLESPWTNAAEKYPPNSITKGTVVKVMEFGAFVQLEPGVEGLVHVSELSPKRVWRVADLVSEGQEVEVMVLSIDPEAERMSLSMKAVAARKEPEKKKEEPEEPGEAPPLKKQKPVGPLKGGLGTSTGGERFGLRW